MVSLINVTTVIGGEFLTPLLGFMKTRKSPAANDLPLLLRLFFGPPQKTIRQHMEEPSGVHLNIVDNLLVTTGNRRGQRWLLTSTRQAAGTTATAIGVAQTLAAKNRSTLLVDANFHDPSLTREICVSGHPGLYQLMTDQASLEDALVANPFGNRFSFLPAGTDKPDPLLFLDEDRLKSCLAMLSDRFDYVILDGPPFESGLDSQLLAPRVDGCILVVRERKTGKQLLMKTRQCIEKANGRLLGLVFNGERKWASKIGRHWS